MIWDKFVLKVLQVKPVDRENPLLKVRVRRYGGRNIPLPEGEEIQKGDRVVELHLNNDYLFQMGVHAHSTVQLSIQLIRLMEQLLPKISEYIHHHPHSEEITGIYGISIIHRGTKKFGFIAIELPKGLFSLLIKMYLRLLLICVHPEGKERLINKTNLLVPMVIAISKKELLSD